MPQFARSDRPRRRRRGVRRRFVAVAAALAAGMALLVGCGNDGQDYMPAAHPFEPTAASPNRPGEPVITIYAYEYAGAREVRPGATVSVRNLGDVAHTLTADKGSGASFDVELVPQGNGTFTAPTKPGTYAYHCRYHSSMHGAITVK